LIELAAGDLAIDSAEMRRRNLISAAEMPYKLPRLEPGGPTADTECDSGNYGEALDRCLAEFDWAEKRQLQGRLIDGRYHGVAVACFIEGAGAGPKETARLELASDGTVAVYVGSAAVGQGLETVMGQIAADTLGIPLDRVRVFHGSTSYLEEGVRRISLAVYDPRRLGGVRGCEGIARKGAGRSRRSVRRLDRGDRACR
jgi:carbon-monoxide dehydrogenase large subunit